MLSSTLLTQNDSLAALNKKETISLKDIFKNVSFIGTRTSGDLIRDKIKNIIDLDKIAIIDFKDIEGITQGFGDSIIGIFVRAYGRNYVKKNIKAINYNEEIKTILNWVVDYNSSIKESAVN